MTVTSTRTRTRKSPVERLIGYFTQWLEVGDEAAVLDERHTELRDRCLDIVEKYGEIDDKGSAFIDLPSPIKFKDHDGTTKVYKSIKREKYVTPAKPLPDPVKTKELLKRKKLWLSKSDQKLIEEIALANPYVKITVDVDVDAVAVAVFNDKLAVEEYDAILQEQREGFRFKPQV